MDNTTVRVTLTPSAGFCIKSSTLQPAVCKVTQQSGDASKTGSVIISPGPTTLSISKGQKVFINFAWDANVPPPPEGSEEEIKRALVGAQEDNGGNGWFVPVIVSEPRNDLDKAGKPSVVLDCVYNSSLKSRTLRDGEFRAFLIELGLQRVEVQHSLALSRQLGTPNISSKGKLFSRTVLVPLRLYPEAHPLREESNKRKLSLIQEVEPSIASAAISKNEGGSEPPKPKGILKKAKYYATSAGNQVQQSGPVSRPKFEWAKEGDRIRITVHAPNVTREQIVNAMLDVEPRRVILDIPGPSPYALDVDLSLPDAQIMAIFGGTSSEDSVLMLKRQRDFDVEAARADWHLSEGKLVLLV